MCYLWAKCERQIHSVILQVSQGNPRFKSFLTLSNLAEEKKKTPCILIKAMYHKTLHMAITTIKRKCIRVHLDVAWYSDTQTQLYWAVKFLFCQKNLSARRLELQPKIIHKKTHEMLIDFNDWCKDNWNVRNEEV